MKNTHWHENYMNRYMYGTYNQQLTRVVEGKAYFLVEQVRDKETKLLT